MEVAKNGVDNELENKVNVIVKVEGLTVWTPEEKSWFRRKITKPAVTILKDVTCCIKGGEFVAVLGPRFSISNHIDLMSKLLTRMKHVAEIHKAVTTFSGAGKTTLLISLASKCNLPSEGSVLVNGVNVKNLPKGFVEIVPQFEAFMGSITVVEHLTFMTEMKLGNSRSLENLNILNSVISDFMLTPHKDTKISSLSGGERKLLSLATSILSRPKILICDEPTTGLDSYNALLVIDVLKKIAQRGIALVCSIHQPSSILFKEFNSIMLMAEGKLLFHGLQEDCKELFESLDLKCPKNYNPAEFYIKAISTDPTTNLSHIDKIEEAFQNRLTQSGSSGSIDYVGPPLDRFKVVTRNWFKQVTLLIWRSSLALKREVLNQLYQLCISMMISATIIGSCYVGISGTTQRGVQDMQGFLWLLTSEIAYGLSYSTLFAFDETMTLYKRECGIYDCSAYFVSKFMCYIPRCIIWPLVFTNIASLAVEFPNHFLTSVKIIVGLIGTAITATSYGLGMGGMFSSTNMTGEFMSFIDLPLFLLSGAFLRLSSIPVWMYGIKYASHFFYSLDIIANIYWRQIDYIECPSNSTQLCVKDGEQYLMQNGYSTNFILIDGCGLLGLTICWSLLGYYGLKREERKGFAY